MMYVRSSTKIPHFFSIQQKAFFFLIGWNFTNLLLLNYMSKWSVRYSTNDTCKVLYKNSLFWYSENTDAMDNYCTQNNKPQQCINKQGELFRHWQDSVLNTNITKPVKSSLYVKYSYYINYLFLFSEPCFPYILLLKTIYYITAIILAIHNIVWSDVSTDWQTRCIYSL